VCVCVCEGLIYGRPAGRKSSSSETNRRDQDTHTAAERETYVTCLRLPSYALAPRGGNASYFGTWLEKFRSERDKKKKDEKIDRKIIITTRHNAHAQCNNDGPARCVYNACDIIYTAWDVCDAIPGSPGRVCSAKKYYTIYYNNISHTRTHVCGNIILFYVCRSAGHGTADRGDAWRWRLFGNSSRSGPSDIIYAYNNNNNIILLDVSMIVFGIIIIIIVTRPRDRI